MPIRGQDGTGQAQGEGGTRRGGEVQCSPEGLAVGGLRLRRRTDCCYLPYSPGLAWGGLAVWGKAHPGACEAALPRAGGRGRLLPAAPAHPRAPRRSPGPRAWRGPRCAGRGRAGGAGPWVPSRALREAAAALRSAGGAGSAELLWAAESRAGSAPSASPHRAGGEPARKPGGRQRARPSHSLGAARPRGWGTSDLGGQQSCAPRAPGVCSRPGGSCSARVPGRLPLPGGSAG